MRLLEITPLLKNTPDNTILSLYQSEIKNNEDEINTYHFILII
jgi:hypothetical protein